MFDSAGKLIIKTLTENQEEYKETYEKTFDKVDISPDSALGSDLAITGEMKTIADEGTQYAFMQNSPHEAIDEGLDNLAFLRGLSRKVDEHSVVLVTFFSEAEGTIISKNTIIANELTDEEFSTDEQGVITNGIFTVFATSINSGRIICKADTINVTDIENVTVNNENDGFVGFDIETNTVLRARLLDYQNTLNIDEQLQIELENLQNVKYVNIVSNSSLSDNGTLPAKATAVIVLGGTNKEIAKKIFATIPSDKLTVGIEEEIIASSITSKEYPIYFSRPTEISLNVDVVLGVSSKFDLDNLGVIKESILSFFSEKYNSDDTVILDSFYVPVQQDFNNQNFPFIGIESVSILVNNESLNIDVNYDEYTILSSSNLTVTVKEGD